MAAWLGCVVAGTGIAGLLGKLPGVEPRPYIIRFTEDRPNPIYRRTCYTLAWSEMIAYAVMSTAGLLLAALAGMWRLQQIYQYAYFPLAATIWIAGAAGWLPRVKSSTKGEGDERRYFYGSVWAVFFAQSALCILWRGLPKTRGADTVKLTAFLCILALFGMLAR